jgi:hypothetical protein
MPAPAAARSVFPPIDEILRRGNVPAKLIGMAQ